MWGALGGQGLQAVLRRATARTRGAHDSAITSILLAVTEADARSWFHHGDYALH
jgi:hypothetical protein